MDNNVCLCKRCGQNEARRSSSGKPKDCPRCLEIFYMDKGPERYAAWKAAGVCVTCLNCPASPGKARCPGCIKRTLAANKRSNDAKKARDAERHE